MMRLMISVTSAEEAHAAMAGGAEILDVKNPAEGSLGAQSPSIIREIKSLISDRVELSAAIGDMPNLPGTAALAALGGGQVLLSEQGAELTFEKPMLAFQVLQEFRCLLHTMPSVPSLPLEPQQRLRVQVRDLLVGFLAELALVQRAVHRAAILGRLAVRWRPPGASLVVRAPCAIGCSANEPPQAGRAP